MLKRILFVLLIPLLIPSPIYAQSNIEIIDLPEEVNIDKEFDLSIELAATPSTSYYLKARGGDALNNLRNSLTLNEPTNVWLTDTSSWTKFPVITTDADGFWSGTLGVKFSTSTTLGQNLVLIRIREINTTKNLDSASEEILVTENSQDYQPVSNENPTSKNIKIILNEFSPAPNEGKEWVEIYNTDFQTAGIGGWKIDDIDGGSNPVTIPENTNIKAKGYFVIYFSNKLNNSGDSIRLLDPVGKQVEEYTYVKVAKGDVFAKDTGHRWQITTTPTPGKKNTITLPKNLVSQESGSPDTNFSTSFVDPEGAGLSDLPELLGITNPSSLESKTTKAEAQTQGLTSKKPRPQSSLSAITVGLGLILIGSAVGLPLLKKENLEGALDKK